MQALVSTVLHSKGGFSAALVMHAVICMVGACAVFYTREALHLHHAHATG